MPGEKLIQTANIWLSWTNHVISARLLWCIRLVHIGAVSKLKKYQQEWKKKRKLKYGIVASAFKLIKPDNHANGYNKITIEQHNS